MHLRELRYFLAVAEEGSITRAAQRLFVSQPALSKQLQTLERQLGTSLLRRQPRGVALTEAGLALVPHARAVVTGWDAAATAVREAIPGGTLVIGMQTAVGRGLQRRALATFRAREPGWVPSLRLVPWTDPTAGLADGTSDVAFLWRPLTVDGLDTVSLREEPRHVLLPAGHPLATHDIVPFAALLDEPFVALPAEAGALREHWLATDARGNRPAVIGAVADTADAVLETVASGVGIALLAEGNVALYARPGVVTRPTSGLRPAVLALAWRVSDRRPAVAAFVAAVEEAAAAT